MHKKLHSNNLALATSPNAVKVIGKSQSIWWLCTGDMDDLLCFWSTKGDLVNPKAHCEIVRHCEESH